MNTSADGADKPLGCEFRREKCTRQERQVLATLAALALISTVCRSSPKISSALSAKVCGRSRSAKIIDKRVRRRQREADRCDLAFGEGKTDMLFDPRQGLIRVDPGPWERTVRQSRQSLRDDARSARCRPARKTHGVSPTRSATTMPSCSSRSTSRSRSGVASMTSNTFSPKARTSFLA